MAGETDSTWDVLLELEADSRGPLLSRLRQALVAAIKTGRLPSGSALPPSRKLAADLGCSRWVVTEAYGQLIAEGYLEARTGSATRVAGSKQPMPALVEVRPSATVPRFDLAPGVPDLRAFPRERWTAAIRAEARRIAFTDLGYREPGGHPRLRRTLASYLGRVRRTAATGGDVTVCAGVTDGVTQVCRALASAGVSAIAVEDPTWPRLRRAAALAGLTAVPVPVDEHGLRIADLSSHPEVRAVLVAPAHQYPTGVVLAPPRRAALLEWARQVDGIVMEDDYDAEFRFDSRPIPSLQGMDPSRVVLLGSVSKTLSPALGIGWIVAPQWLTNRLRAQCVPTAGPPTLDQLALAAFIEGGQLDRHLRSMRKRYRVRRDALVTALGKELPARRLSGIPAGLHLLLSLPAGADESAVVREAASRGVRVWSLDRHRARRPPAADPGLVIGYGNLVDGAVGEAARALAAAIAAAANPDSAVRLGA